ncbi:MAG: biotin transporter BioY [Caldiserica bacterium]|nr:biotin transporter BioY [Caldisericota bacterium]
MKLSTRRVAQLAVMVALLVIGAYVSIPLRPVPITFQDAFVVLTPLLFGSTAYVAILAYLLLGLVGLPAFTGGASGLVALSGPTGGFLVGFLLAAIVVGFLADHWHWKSWWRDLVLAEGSLILIYVPGVLWLWHVLLLRGGAAEATLLGLVPILALDVAKMAVVAVLARPLRSALAEV